MSKTEQKINQAKNFQRNSIYKKSQKFKHFYFLLKYFSIDCCDLTGIDLVKFNSFNVSIVTFFNGTFYEYKKNKIKIKIKIDKMTNENFNI